jgi:ubiquinone/menaquinone biosynthesis C-methylase UbiE
MNEDRNRVCPVELAGGLDTTFRKWFQNPRKIVGPYVSEGMSVLDVGCGPGFFSIEMGALVGDSGRVIAADLQDGMLQIVRKKIQGSPLEKRITLHKCEQGRIGVADTVDFALAFYMVHEVPDKASFFKELRSIVKAGGRMLIVEPPLHVTKAEFAQTLDLARKAGFEVIERPRMLFHAVACLG